MTERAGKRVGVRHRIDLETGRTETLADPETIVRYGDPEDGGELAPPLSPAPERIEVEFGGPVGGGLVADHITPIGRSDLIGRQAEYVRADIHEAVKNERDEAARRLRELHGIVERWADLRGRPLAQLAMEQAAALLFKLEGKKRD